MLGRVLGIDFGESKVGLALSDELGILAQPLQILDFREDGFWEDLEQICKEKRVVKIVIGVPGGFAGETDQTRVVRDFVEEVKSKIDLPIETAPEIFSTKIAQSQREHLPKNRRQKADDAEAASVILQGWLEARR